MHSDATESYKIFQRRIQDEYEHTVKEYGLAVMDATRAVEVQQRALRELILPYITGNTPNAAPDGDSPVLLHPAYPAYVGHVGGGR